MVVDRWDNAETFAAAQVPQFAIDVFVVNDDGVSNGDHRSGIKV